MSTTLLLALVLMTTSADNAPQSWTSFRNGGASRAEDANLPTRWSPAEGIAWQRELPGYGQSTPAVTDASIPTLASLTAVDLLDVTRSGMSDDGIAELQRRLPGVQVNRRQATAPAVPHR